MIDGTVQGIHAIGLGTQGFRHMYGKREVRKVEDLKGYKVRVQATATEDTMFAAYGAQTVHMPFGSVYTSLQTGVMDFGENAVNVYLINRHYEVAPVLSMTEHEANNAILWISDKLWQSLNAEQRAWVQAAARDVSTQEPKRAFELEKAAAAKLEKMGVKIVNDVDKTGFQKIADPYLDKLAKELGPHAEKIKDLIRGDQLVTLIVMAGLTPAIHRLGHDSKEGVDVPAPLSSKTHCRAFAGHDGVVDMTESP